MDFFFKEQMVCNLHCKHFPNYVFIQEAAKVSLEHYNTWFLLSM